MLSRFLTSRGLRAACLHHDLCATMNRLKVTQNESELDALTDEQVAMLLVMSNQKPGSGAWQYAESRLGPLPIEETNHGQS